jgi:FtsH-binding integral membrane protein
MAAEANMKGDGATRLGVLGALGLYLDSVNMILFMRRLMRGGRR